MRILIAYTLIIMLGCTSDLSPRSSYVDFNLIFKKWDSATLASLSISNRNLDSTLLPKVSFLIRSIKASDSDFNILDRINFKNDLLRSNLNMSIRDSMRILILESNISGEKNIARKHLVNLEDDSCFVFNKSNSGNWILTKKYILSDKRRKILDKLILENQSYKDHNCIGRYTDFFIASTFTSNGIVINPIFCYSEDDFIDLLTAFNDK